jgi:23S rRNA (uracil1939-C5)-methyltransferase
VLELYAGHGNFTVALASGARSYTAVEQDPAAVQALRRNLARRGLAPKVVEGDAAAQRSGGPLDLLVLDPPRAGAPQVLEHLLPRKMTEIVYVSCDPATLARDLAPLFARGYRVTWAEVFDMFPQTADLESLVVLART